MDLKMKMTLPFKSGLRSTFVLFNLLTISLIRFSTFTVRTWKEVTGWNIIDHINQQIISSQKHTDNN